MSMTQTRWSQVRAIFFAAQELDAHARATFIHQASAGDFNVEQEVLRLLALDAKAGSFLEKPAALKLALSAPPIETAEQTMATRLTGDDGSESWIERPSADSRLQAGAHLGPYEIIAPLGAGGMGEVYKARDTRLDRTVAIKLISSRMAGNPRWESDSAAKPAPFRR